MTGRYDDIIDLPHPVSKTHRPMPMSDRAAQFSPFAALTGFESALQETERLTEQQIFLDEDEITAINGVLCQLRESLSQQPTATVRYFVPDERKAGGSYVSATGVVKRIDDIEQRLIFADGTVISLQDIVSITTP
jgi:hypothetical protein